MSTPFLSARSALFSLTESSTLDLFLLFGLSQFFCPLIQVLVFYIVSCRRQLAMLVLHVALGNSLA